MRFSGVFGIVALLVSTSVSVGDLRFRPVVLNQSNFAYAKPSAINDAGTVVGTLSSSGFFDPSSPVNRAAVWNAGTNALTLLAAPAGYVGMTAYDINNSGLIVGVATSSGGGSTAFRRDNSSFISTPSTVSRLYAVNDAGDSVGVGLTTSKPIRLTNQTVTDLNSTSTASGWASSISSNGTVVGNLRISQFQEERAYLLRPGFPATRLETSTSLFSSDANGVNSKGLIVGDVGVSIPGQAAIGHLPVRFENGTYVTLPGGFTGVGENSGSPSSVNDQGWIGGTRGSPTSSASERTATLWIGNQYHELTTMLAPEYGGLITVTHVLAINNRGQMTAWATQDIDGDPATPGKKLVAVRLDPIRAPGDTNYDNIVDFADLIVLAKSLGQSGNGNVFYETGDFNYDWIVDSADVQIAGNNYVSPELFADHWAHAQAVIPEPAVAFIGGIAFVISRRRL